MNAKPLVTLALAIAFFGAWPGLGRAERKWSLYRNKKYGFQFVLLKDWKVSDARTHPAILVAAFHPSGAQVRLSAAVLPTRVTLLSWVRSELKVLRKLGLQVGQPMSFSSGSLKGLWARGTHPTKPYSFRVYFFNHGRAYFAFTLTYETRRYKAVMRAFQIMLLTFKFTK